MSLSLHTAEEDRLKVASTRFMPLQEEVHQLEQKKTEFEADIRQKVFIQY